MHDPKARLDLSPIEPTIVYDSFWYFAAERQNVFFEKLSKSEPPWTTDIILKEFKFTNAYRASDRVSQFLIKEVIYKGTQSFTEVFFRTIIFKIFNKIATWRLLENELGAVSYESYSFETYDRILSSTMDSGIPIFSAAYIMPSGAKSFKYRRKHRSYLKLLETMIEDDVPRQINQSKTMQHAFSILRSYPMIGDFLAYQYIIDLNYSDIVNFSEMEFVVPGPGAKNGIRKCFRDLGGLNEVEIIQLVCKRQEIEFQRLGIAFKSLWGRRLQLIDCQNLFCEVDKYARIAHPDFQGKTTRTRIKQKYKPQGQEIKYWYPPKWGINDRIGR